MHLNNLENLQSCLDCERNQLPQYEFFKETEHIRSLIIVQTYIAPH